VYFRLPPPTWLPSFDTAFWFFFNSREIDLSVHFSLQKTVGEYRAFGDGTPVFFPFLYFGLWMLWPLGPFKIRSPVPFGPNPNPPLASPTEPFFFLSTHATGNKDYIGPMQDPRNFLSSFLVGVDMELLRSHFPFPFMSGAFSAISSGRALLRFRSLALRISYSSAPGHFLFFLAKWRGFLVNPVFPPLAA